MSLCRKCERSSVAMELDDQYAFGLSGQLQVAVGSQIVVSKCLHDVLLCVLNLTNHFVSALLDDQRRSFPRRPIPVECRFASECLGREWGSRGQPNLTFGHAEPKVYAADLLKHRVKSPRCLMRRTRH